MGVKLCDCCQIVCTTRKLKVKGKNYDYCYQCGRCPLYGPCARYEGSQRWCRDCNPAGLPDGDRINERHFAVRFGEADALTVKTVIIDGAEVTQRCIEALEGTGGLRRPTRRRDVRVSKSQAPALEG